MERQAVAVEVYALQTETGTGMDEAGESAASSCNVESHVARSSS